MEGRGEQHLNTNSKADNDAAGRAGWSYDEALRQGRARNLYNLWKMNNILNDIQEMNGESFVSGSGFGGQGRYSGYGEDGENKNKTFIIQIIPYIN